MAILNLSPDSFHAPSRTTAEELANRARKMLGDGADILDLGAVSTRPGAGEVPQEEEERMLTQGVRILREALGDDVLISVDTWRASVARKAVEAGADMINDISGGTLDPAMFDTVAELAVPYILTHMRGTPATMQTLTDYDDVVADVIEDLSRKLGILEEKGVADVIVDPGFGFAKTLRQNYRLLACLDKFAILGRPVLAGMSRKSMLTRLLGISAEESLTATAVAGALALERGASILRVHDPKEASQTIAIINELTTAAQCSTSE